MVMKAVSKNINKSINSENKVIDNIDNDTMDGFVMVLFPIDTWSKVQEMAKKIGMETNSVMSVALELMEDEILKKQGRKKRT